MGYCASKWCVNHWWQQIPKTKFAAGHLLGKWVILLLLFIICSSSWLDTSENLNRCFLFIINFRQTLKHPESFSSRPGGKPNHTHSCWDEHHSCRERDQYDSNACDSQQHNPGMLCIQHFHLWTLCTRITIRQQWDIYIDIKSPLSCFFCVCDVWS